MIIVMPDGHALTGNPGQVTSDLISRNVEAFTQELLKEIIPMIETTYRVKPTRQARAIIGLSMGGGQSLSAGLQHRDVFGSVGGMSSYLPEPERLVEATFAGATNGLESLWIACGRDDRLIENARALSSALKAKGIPHEFKETPGNHSWPVWRRHLGEYMPMLFPEKPRNG
jgi:enterochelin esterase family protein